MCELLANELKIDADDVIVASTGVIGVPLPIEPIGNGIPSLVSSLGSDEQSGIDAATAILTTDIKMKKYCYTFELDGKKVTLGGMCKGSGMIQPIMATMPLYHYRCSISQQCSTAHCVGCRDSFNMVSVDGDQVQTNGFASSLQATPGIRKYL